MKKTTQNFINEQIAFLESNCDFKINANSFIEKSKKIINDNSFEKLSIVFQNLVDSSFHTSLLKKQNYKALFSKEMIEELLDISKGLNPSDYPDYQKHMKYFIKFRNFGIREYFHMHREMIPFEHLNHKNFSQVKKIIFSFYTISDKINKISGSKNILDDIYYFVIMPFRVYETFKTPYTLSQYMNNYKDIPEFIDEHLVGFKYALMALKAEENFYSDEYVVKEKIWTEEAWEKYNYNWDYDPDEEFPDLEWDWAKRIMGEEI